MRPSRRARATSPVVRARLAQECRAVRMPADGDTDEPQRRRLECVLVSFRRHPVFTEQPRSWIAGGPFRSSSERSPCISLALHVGGRVDRQRRRDEAAVEILVEDSVRKRNATGVLAIGKKLGTPCARSCLGRAALRPRRRRCTSRYARRRSRMDTPSCFRGKTCEKRRSTCSRCTIP